MRLPSSIECYSWLAYVRASDQPDCIKIRNLIIHIKNDRIEPRKGVPFVRLTVARLRDRFAEEARMIFSADAVLVPVPRARLTKPGSLWPAQRVCQELVNAGLGTAVVPMLLRTTAVPKSAGSPHRLNLDTLLPSLTVQPPLDPPGQIVLVDDVVTTGATMMSCAIAIAEVFPTTQIRGFAIARAQETVGRRGVVDARVERITVEGNRCVRRPLRSVRSAPQRASGPP